MSAMSTHEVGEKRKEQKTKNKDAHLSNEYEDRVDPVRAVGEVPEVRERFLRTAYFLLLARERVRELDDETAVALPLEGGEGQNARQVVSGQRTLFFREVANEMEPPEVDGADDVEEEWVDVEVQRLVVQEDHI